MLVGVQRIFDRQIMKSELALQQPQSGLIWFMHTDPDEVTGMLHPITCFFKGNVLDAPPLRIDRCSDNVTPWKTH